MKVLNAALERNYINQVASIFASRYPEKFPAGIDAAASFIQRNIQRALGYGIGSELHIATFLNFLILYGEDFESRPDCVWATDILKSGEGSGDDRVEWLEARRQKLQLLEAAFSSRNS